MYTLKSASTKRTVRTSLDGIVYRFLQFMRGICPVDKGNMRDTMRATKSGRDEYSITINPDNEAPYAVYTNEKWIADRWKGKHNPNEKWIDSGVTTFAMYLAQSLGGELTTDGTTERWENKNYYDSIIDSGK